MLAHRPRHEFGLEDAVGGGEVDLGGHRLSRWTWERKRAPYAVQIVLGQVKFVVVRLVFRD